MKKLVLVTCILLALINIGCRKTDSPSLIPIDTTKIPDLPKEGILVKTSVFGRIVDEKDLPLNGVTINAGGATTITDVNGIYMLTDVMLDQGRAYITAVAPGYFKGSRIFQPVVNGMSRPPLIKMLQQKSIGVINATSGGAVESKGGTRVELPANAIEGYTGAVTVVAGYINPTSPDFFARMPGDLAADNAQSVRGALISYGMSNIDLLDDKGAKVKIKQGMQATITLPVPTKLQATAQPTIAMWYFDETKGIWKEEGSGTYQGGKYVGKVSHFSTWNYDHFSLNMIIPFFLRWVPKLATTLTSTDQDNVLNNPPDFVLTVKDKTTKTTLYSNVFPPPVRDAGSNPPRATTTVSFPLPTISNSMEVTVTPVQPGGPDYPTNTDYSPNADETSPATPTFATEQESVTVDVTPTTPPTTITITVPPTGGGGGNGETVVNVNGKAVNCANQPVTRGYAFLSMRSGNTIVKSTTAPVYGTEGRFTAQYIFYNALPNRIDNVVLNVYDLQTGKKTKDIAINVNPSVAYMIADPVKICDVADNGGTTTGKVYTGDYSINDAVSLKAFIDSGYTQVTGMLNVANVGDLGGIIKLKKVSGLSMRNASLTSLGGLAELEEMSYLAIVNCNQLTNAAFPKLGNKTMQGIHINNNLGLTALTLPSIETISPLGNDNISITGSPILKTLSIPNLKSVDKCGSIEITNTILTNLNTFAGASGTLGTWGINLTDNSELTSVNGMSNIITTGRVTIDQCPKLSSLDGINVPAIVTDWVQLTRNDALVNISAIGDKLKSTASLSINSNNALVTAQFPLLENGSVACKENPLLTTLSMPKLKDAAAVDITHNLKLSSLNLNALETAPNGFNLEGGLDAVNSLTTFDLPALKSVGRFVISNCPGIVHLDGFANLVTVTQDLVISNGYIEGTSVALQSINGFNKLSSLPASLNIETASGTHYTGPLASIKGFQNLVTIAAMLNIGGKKLTDISGFVKLQTVGQDMRIINTGLNGLGGFGKLTSSGLEQSRLIYISDNEKLTTLSGLTSIVNLTGIYITNNAALLNLDGLKNVKSLKGGITINRNNKLANIDGLTNVDGVINGISITDNPVLKSLCGITKLVKTGGNTGGYGVSSNGYNPTAQDIKDGKCSQ